MEPRVHLDFGARAAPHLGSTMDSSDGLSTTLNEMAARSGMAIIVDGEPAANGVAEFAAKHGLDPDGLVYHGGEEYEIVFTLRPGGINDIFSAVRGHPHSPEIHRVRGGWRGRVPGAGGPGGPNPASRRGMEGVLIPRRPKAGGAVPARRCTWRR